MSNARYRGAARRSIVVLRKGKGVQEMQQIVKLGGVGIGRLFHQRKTIIQGTRRMKKLPPSPAIAVAGLGIPVGASSCSEHR